MKTLKNTRNNMDKKRVLITYIESGMGHIMSAKSICDSLKKFYGEELDIVESNIMKDSNNKYQIKMEKFLIQQTQWTNKIKGYGFFIFGFIQSFGSQKFLRFTHKTLFKKACDATIEAMKSYNPDCIVSTHYFITYCAIELKKRYLPNLRVVTYNPDNNVHMWWDNRDGIFINNNRLAEIEALKTRKFKYKNLRNVTFTARNDIINENNTKEFYREKYNLPKDKFTVIVADGAYALGRAKTVTNELIKTSKPITILILTGKNEELYDYFKNKKVKSNITLIPMKFTPLAFELYKASDLFITKAGPNAILDSMYMRTPVIVDYYAHPIEKATTKLFIEKYKCGELSIVLKNLLKMVHN
jgi:UDP-N-acetylglucosamine:LPS N-acetylglucosamine transferase